MDRTVLPNDSSDVFPALPCAAAVDRESGTAGLHSPCWPARPADRLTHLLHRNAPQYAARSQDHKAVPKSEFAPSPARESLLVQPEESVPENQSVPLAGTTPARSKDRQTPASVLPQCASDQLLPTAVRRPGTIRAEQRPHLRLVGECPDALPHPSHRGRPPRAAAVPATSDSFRPEPSSHDACHPSCDSNEVSTCVDPTSLHFTFKSVGLHYKRVHRPPRTRIRDAHCKHEC